MTKYYTRKGDDGLTTWLGKGRLKKYDLRLEALGSLDESSATLGLARSMAVDTRVKEIILHVQRDLSGMMGEVAADPAEAERFRTIHPAQVAWLEEQADGLMENLEAPHSFLMSGDTPGGGAIDLARATVRRAERNVVELSDSGGIKNLAIIAYLNRLSSLLFVLELAELKAGGFEALSQAK
jgi:cob(I)alamin adenosyltransferase